MSCMVQRVALRGVNVFWISGKGLQKGGKSQLLSLDSLKTPAYLLVLAFT